jgi:aspartate carbamoyltransferase catalytic subunit
LSTPAAAGARSASQRRPDGSLRHLLSLEGLTRSEIDGLLDAAQNYVREVGTAPPRNHALAGVTIGNLFTEPSTRTRVSFELAGRRLGAEVVNLEVQLSSRAKGETMLDTIYTLESLHFDMFVIRDAEPGVVAHVAENVAPHVSVISAGEAHVSHPTQGLLDALTIRQHKGRDFSKLRIAIVGDIRHSRVARSAYEAFTLLGTGELRIVAPPALMADAGEFPGCVRFESLEEGLAGADVVMMLRIQKERMNQASIPDGDDYFNRYGLTPERVRLAKPDAIVMHPQPMNRGIEIASEVADGPQSVIRAQVRNGVAVRMAVLEKLARPLK